MSSQIILYEQVSAPSTPFAGTAAIYIKSDGLLYVKDDAGVESVPAVTSGGFETNFLLMGA